MLDSWYRAIGIRCRRGRSDNEKFSESDDASRLWVHATSLINHVDLAHLLVVFVWCLKINSSWKNSIHRSHFNYIIIISLHSEGDYVNIMSLPSMTLTWYPIDVGSTWEPGSSFRTLLPEKTHSWPPDGRQACQPQRYRVSVICHSVIYLFYLPLPPQDAPSTGFSVSCSAWSTSACWPWCLSSDCCVSRCPTVVGNSHFLIMSPVTGSSR